MALRTRVGRTRLLMQFPCGHSAWAEAGADHGRHGRGHGRGHVDGDGHKHGRGLGQGRAHGHGQRERGKAQDAVAPPLMTVEDCLFELDLDRDEIRNVTSWCLAPRTQRKTTQRQVSQPQR